MDSNAEKLLKMKESIEKAEATANQAEGSLSTLMGQLKEHGCKTLEEAEAKLDDLDRQIIMKEEALGLGIKELEDKYDWTPETTD